MTQQAATQQQAAPIPLPEITLDNRGYWEACKKHELRVQKCKACGSFRFPPRPICNICNSLEHEWTLCSGKGKLYSYVVVTQPMHPAWKGKTPFGVVLVELDEGVRIISTLVDVPPDQIKIGMPLQVAFEDVSEDITLPKFKRAGT